MSLYPKPSTQQTPHQPPKTTWNKQHMMSLESCDVVPAPGQGTATNPSPPSQGLKEWDRTSHRPSTPVLRSCAGWIERSGRMECGGRPTHVHFWGGPKCSLQKEIVQLKLQREHIMAW